MTPISPLEHHSQALVANRHPPAWINPKPYGRYNLDISELTQAITAGVGLKTLARTIHPYPTQAEASRKLADAYNRTRLTPWVQALFRKWFTWAR